MACPHGCPPNSDAGWEGASGECYTCLARREPCDCAYCIASMQKAVDEKLLAQHLPWYRDWLAAKKLVITKKNFHYALDLCDRVCTCKHTSDPTAPGAEDDDAVDCYATECSLCARMLCPHEDPFHTHHDGCPACL